MRLIYRMPQVNILSKFRWKHFLAVRSYMTCSRNILHLKDRGIFLNVFPEDRTEQTSKMSGEKLEVADALRRIGNCADWTPDLYNALQGASQGVYCGFDPTADSLHIGNLLAIMALLHCQRAGHQVVALLGGATAQIGDPSGRGTERNALELQTIQTNVDQIRTSLERIFHNHYKYFWDEKKKIFPAKILDNSEWYAKRNIIEFLSTVGRNFRMGTMLGRESVKSRLKTPEGMSLTEFTYQVFQAYDWLHLYRNFNCLVQIGGNDQIGNIMTGHDLISRLTRKHVFGLTVPLVTTTTGDKLGKTAGNAVWLKPDKTTPYELYQFYINLADKEVEKYLNMFTFLSDPEIETIVRRHTDAPQARKAQKTIAENVTLLVHGEEGLNSAKRCTDALFSGSAEDLAALEEKELMSLFKNAPTTEMILEPGTTIFETVMKARCFGREVDAERVLKAGGVYINHRRVTQPEAVLIPGEHILPNSITLIRVGKKNYYVIKWLGMQKLS